MRPAFRLRWLSAWLILAVVAGAGHEAIAEAPAPYGLIGRMVARPGQAAALAAVLSEGTGSMPGCVAYLVSRDATDADSLWITEVWRSKADHDASLSLPQVKAAIAKGRPLIASFGESHETIPVTPRP